MKVATFETDGRRHVGIVDVDAGTVQAIACPAAAALPSVADLVAHPDCLAAPQHVGRPVPLASVRLLAPIPRPARNIFCVGKNYHAHAQEFAKSGFDSSAAAGAVPKVPIVFSKVPESVIASGEAILYDPRVSTAIDYEVELAVIIGKGGRGIAPGDAMAHVWGYTIVNDVTARDLQGRHSQWLIGKSQDTFCPMGPWAVTADEVDLATMRVRTWVNGEKRQDASVADLIFDVPTLIATLAEGITLQPGDIIATGTPDGVGIGFSPPRYLTAGDLVRQEITGIGIIENRVMERAA